MLAILNKMPSNITPIFIFSLPRSGSTLLQRALASHPKIATTAEPWLLIPQIGIFASDGIFTWANHSFTRTAIEDFCRALPGGLCAYNRHLRKFILNLYREVSPETATHFVDKTPRYHMISKEILSLFGEEAHYIFLWRHPLSIVASIVESWHHGRWNLSSFEIDLFGGLENLVSTYAKNQNRAYSVNYEAIVQFNHNEWGKVFSAINLDMPDNFMKNYTTTKINGIMGDCNAKKQPLINKNSISKWLLTFNNPLRKRWARKYIDWIGSERLQIMGYDKDEIISDLESIPNSNKKIISDLAYCTAEQTAKWFELRLIFSRMRKVKRGKRHYPIFSCNDKQ